MVEYKTLHEVTIGDPVATAHACVALRATLEQLVDQERVRQQEADRPQKQIADLLAAMAALSYLGDLAEGESFDMQEDLDAAGDEVAALEALCADSGSARPLGRRPRPGR